MLSVFPTLHFIPMPIPQTNKLPSQGPVAVALVNCFSFTHSNYFYLESVPLDSECLSCLSCSSPLIGKMMDRWKDRSQEDGQKDGRPQIKTAVHRLKYMLSFANTARGQTAWKMLMFSLQIYDLLSPIFMNMESICLRHDAVAKH